MSNALPEPDRSCPTRTAIPLLFPIGRVPFFSGLLGLDPCASAFLRSGVRSHRILGALQSRSLRPPNPLCSPSQLARRTGRNRSEQSKKNKVCTVRAAKAGVRIFGLAQGSVQAAFKYPLFFFQHRIPSLPSSFSSHLPDAHYNVPTAMAKQG